MTVLWEVLIALALLGVVWIVWSFLQELFPESSEPPPKKDGRPGKDYTGIAVSCFCHDGAGKYLLEKRSAGARDEQGAWNPGGGTVEFNERVEDAVRREVKEEFCVDVLDMELLGYRDVVREKGGVKTHWLLLDFKVHIDPKGVTIGDPTCIDEIRWVTIDTIPSPMHSFFPAYLDKYKGKL